MSACLSVCECVCACMCVFLDLFCYSCGEEKENKKYCKMWGHFPEIYTTEQGFRG